MGSPVLGAQDHQHPDRSPNDHSQIGEIGRGDRPAAGGNPVPLPLLIGRPGAHMLDYRRQQAAPLPAQALVLQFSQGAGESLPPMATA